MNESVELSFFYWLIKLDCSFKLHKTILLLHV